MACVALDRFIPQEPKKPTPKALARAEQDLEWWHGPRVAELGEAAQSYDFGSTHVHDAEAAWRQHERMTSWRRQRALRQAERIGPRLWRLSSVHRRVADAIYTPRPWVWADSAHLRLAFSVERPPSFVCLVGAVLMTNVVRQAFRSAHGGKDAFGAQLFEWVGAALDPRVDAKRQKQPLPKWAKAALEEARGMRSETLESYAS